MKNTKRLATLLVLTFSFSLLLTACNKTETPAPAPIMKTPGVEKPMPSTPTY